MKTFSKSVLSVAVIAATQMAVAGTEPYFTPLTQSTAVASPNHVNELNGPWTTPAGISQVNLTSMSEIEADINQSVVRATGLDSGASMWDMVAYDPTGQYIFIPHETQIGAGVSRYDIANDFNEVLFSGDEQGANGNWTNDYGAFDPARFTPAGTVIAGEEWSGEGRVIEITNPMASANNISIRELDAFANVSHEGIMFSKKDPSVVYYVDENNSGSIYKLVFNDPTDYSAGGQNFVLVVNDFVANGGAPTSNWNGSSVARTGAATWVAISDASGNPITPTDAFAPGQGNGRAAADEVNGTPYGRPEDAEIGTLANGNEVLYFAATSERTIYSVEITGASTAMVRVFADESNTPKNLGFLPTTGVINSPDNLAQDALGNIYIIEDAPNSSDVGGDIWFVRDVDNDGVAESVDHFLSIQVDGAEATGMIFNPAKPTEFVVAVQHPDSTDLTEVPNGFGDALWKFDITDVVPPTCQQGSSSGVKRNAVRTCSYSFDTNFVRKLNAAK